MFIDYSELAKLMGTPEELRRTEEYLADKLGMFLKPGEKILLCFPCEDHDSIGLLMERAARRAGVIPLMWKEDLRWKALLKLAFDSRATAIAGSPQTLLGLTKLARYTHTPLNFRYVITSGYPCMDWIVYGIRRGLDCDTLGAFGVGFGPVVAGFSCSKNLGVHLRDDFFDLEILDDNGESVPQGDMGYIVLHPKNHPELRFRPGDRGRLALSPCPCGCKSPRLIDLDFHEGVDMSLVKLARDLLTWSSVLDCRIRRGECGLALEMVVFPGEKLPKLPTVAKQIVRPWNPEEDTPFLEVPGWKVPNSG